MQDTLRRRCSIVLQHVAVLSLLCLAIPLWAAQPAAAGDPCFLNFEQITKSDDWLTRLMDPVVTTREEVAGRLELYKTAYQCLPDNPQTDQEKAVKLLTGYYLAFVGGYQTPEGASTLSMLDLANVRDPAIVRIREEVGIKPAPGYVFVRIYSSRQAMPPLVRRAFEDENVRGVTLFTRYIAVLSDRAGDEALRKTLSHELVHAYLGSAGGVLAADKFPKWYHEGFAIYMSGSGQESCRVTIIGASQITSCQRSPDEYRQYDENFKYLENQLGKERLAGLLKQSFDGRDASVLYRALPAASYDQFAARAHEWKSRQDMLMYAGIGALCLIPLAAVLFLWWRRSGAAPEVAVPTVDAEPVEAPRHRIEDVEDLAWSAEARDCLYDALRHQQRLNSGEVDVPHVLLGIMSCQPRLGAEMMHIYGVSQNRFVLFLESLATPPPAELDARMARMARTRIGRMIAHSDEIASATGDLVLPHHIFKAAIEVDDRVRAYLAGEAGRG
jgi:hypothetical protein